MSYSDGLQQFVGGIIQDEAGPADSGTMVVAGPISIEYFSTVCAEAGSVNVTKAVYSLEVRNADGGGATEYATITIPDSLAVGDVKFSTDTDLPLKVTQGKIVALKHKTAATGAGGATYPSILFRVDGYDNTSAKGVAS